MSHERKVSVIGLGYVGLPVAAAFGRGDNSVIAFDIDRERIAELARGYDRTNEMTDEEMRGVNLELTADEADLAAADFHIITVPTPIDRDNRPDLGPLCAASETVGRILKQGDIVVYESTVYPGATEEVCVPILEAASGMTMGEGFSVGYSPERINPGDREHRFETITKVVSGSDDGTLGIVAGVYESVVKAGVHRAPNLKTAEAAKVIENTQRDLNIALMNELSLIFGNLGIDTRDVLAAAGTKWNFLPFVPGLVGGHCIGVDPYYLTHRAEQTGYNPEVILAGRRINDSMGAHVARSVASLLEKKGKDVPGARIALLGVTFKENVPDVRNTRIGDVIRELERLGCEVQAHDPIADESAASRELGISLSTLETLESADAVILGVPHTAFVSGGWDLITGLLKNREGIVADIKGCLNREQAPSGITLWRL